jgi:ribonuclease VapC
MFVDASAICAILLGEPEAEAFKDKLTAATRRSTSAIAVFECVRALMRVTGVEPETARALVAEFLDAGAFEVATIAQPEREAALDAMARFGRGRHAAQLNMGDCFAYACARSRGEPLLFKGNDFPRTDIAIA